LEAGLSHVGGMKDVMTSADSGATARVSPRSGVVTPASSSKVSILIPTFNQEEFIGACIGSALQQTYGNLEVIVSDDASTDATGQIARQFLADPRVRYERNPENMGRVGNYRRLLNELAAGDWILMLDGDDCLLNPHYVAHAMELARSAADVVLVFGKQRQGRDFATSTLLNHASNLPPLMDGSTFFLQHPPFFDVEPLVPTCLFRRDIAIRTGFFRYDILSSDFESLYRLMIGHKIGFLDEVAGLWRQHDRNASKTCSYQVYRDNFRALTGPYENAQSLDIFAPGELRLWLRKGGARYFLFCLHRLLATGRVWDALRLIGYVLTVDSGIVGHSLDRLARRTTRGLRNRFGLARTS
jgi:glycosyltransferase involved in cell wall biosynthesis